MTAAAFTLTGIAARFPVRSAAQVEQVGNHEPTVWLRRTLTSIERRIQAGQIRPCGHATMRNFVPAWNPGAGMLCGHCCDHANQGIPSECDRCGRPGTVIPSGHRPAGRPWTLAFRLCPACDDAERGAA